MGFNYYGIGNILSCGITKGKVFFRLPSGKVCECATMLTDEVPEQCNLFISDTVLFLLYTEDKEYIGRYDGSISVYAKGTDLLIGLNVWTPPTKFLTLCGHLAVKQIVDDVYVIGLDDLSLGTPNMRCSSVMSSKYLGDFNLNLSLSMASSGRNDLKSFIYDIGGNFYETSTWTIQTGLREQNCPVFL